MDRKEWICFIYIVCVCGGGSVCVVKSHTKNYESAANMDLTRFFSPSFTFCQNESLFN